MYSNQILRANPHLNEAIEMLDQHLYRYKGDVKQANECLTKTEVDFVTDEIEHCIVDPRYYLENYHVIQTEDEGLKTLAPFWDSQEIFYLEVVTIQQSGRPVKIIVLKARQLGLSTVSEGLVFHKTIFTETCNSLIVAQDPGQADFLFSMSRLAYDYLPWWMRPEERYQAKGRYLILDKKDDIERQLSPGLRSQILVEAANKLSGVARGKTIRACHFSEMSSWGDGGILAKSIFPTMNAADELAIMESTALGRVGFFYDFWRDCEEGNQDWHPVFIEFFRVKKYSRPIPEDTYFGLTKEEEAIRAKVAKKTGFHITDETFNWRRAKLREFKKLEGDEWGFYQEYPSNCLIGSTRVPTSTGIHRIEVCPEQVTTNGKTITRHYAKGIGKLYRVTTHLGYEIIGTFDHMVPTDNGEVKLGLLKGESIFLSPPELASEHAKVEWQGPCGAHCSILVDEDFARFLGYFLGDGSYGKSTVSICCDGKDRDVIEDVKYLMNKFFGNAYERKVGTKKGGVEVRVGSKDFKVVMKALGIWNDSYGPRRKVKLPEEIWLSPKSVVREFLRGLYEADGWNGFGTPRVGLYSKDWDFLRDIQILLLSFGITSSRRERDAVNGNHREYKARTLDLRAAEARLFNREIGFIGERKRLHHRDVDCPSGRPQAKISFRDVVREVIPCGEAIVYDISVSGDHLYSANGILVHNSMEAFQGSGLCAFPKQKLQQILESQCDDPRWYGEIEYKHEGVGAHNKYKVHLSEVRQGVSIPKQDVDGGRLYVWEQPDPEYSYYLGVDVAHGIAGGDYSCIQVLKIGHGPEPDVQVAEWHGWINPTPFGHTIAAMGYWYNTAQIAVECNDVGMSTNAELFRILEYENIYRWKHIDKIKNFMTDFFGWYTNHKTRDTIISKCREAIMEDTIILYSAKLVDEMLDFASDDGGKIEGQNSNDDRVMALLIARYCAHESDFGKQAAAQPTSGRHRQENWEIYDNLGRKVAVEKDYDKAFLWIATRSGFSMRPQVTKNKITWVLVDVNGKKVKEVDDFELANELAMLNKWSMRQSVSQVDFQNTEASPVHDKPGVRQKLYDLGIAPEAITSEALLYAHMASGPQPEDSENDWKNL